MSIVDGLRRASEALRKAADDLQSLSDEVYMADGEMSDEQASHAFDLYQRAYQDAHRLDGALSNWRLERLEQRDKAGRQIHHD